MKKYLAILWLLCIIGLVFFIGHYSGILIDFGREVYYPEQILNGKVLYKDLFNIYGPLAYQINALIYKLFGAKLSTLYGAGAVCSLLTVSGIFLIARRFLSDFLSFCIGFFAIITGITTVSIFNFHFPYSWAMLYGLVAFLYSLLFLLKFEETQKSKFLIISSFLAGICVTCKYDFILYLPVILFFIFKNKNFKALLSFLIIPATSFGILFIQGLNFADIFNTFQIINTMAHTKTLTYFYQNSGVYFHSGFLYMNVFWFILFLIPFGTMLYGASIFTKRKWLSVVIIFFSVIFELIWARIQLVLTFPFLPILLLLAIIFYYKKFDCRMKILLISVVLVCFKVFWGIFLNSYGNFYIPLLFIALLSVLFINIDKKYEKIAGIFILIFCLVYFEFDMAMYLSSNQTIKTTKGTITTNFEQAKSTNLLIDFINQNTKPENKIVIFPEGMTINFLTDRKSDDFYNSLIPLYIETFGEEKIIEHFESDKPDYIILNNLNTKDYYYKYICQDYALEFCEFIQKNYKQQAVINGDFRYIVFKKL